MKLWCSYCYSEAVSSQFGFVTFLRATILTFSQLFPNIWYEVQVPIQIFQDYIYNPFSLKKGEYENAVVAKF